MIIWHMMTKGEDDIWVQTALLACKFRSIELTTGLLTQHARHGAAYDDNIPEKRAAERVRVEKAEQAYADFTAQWRPRPPAKPRLRSKMLAPA